MTNYNLIAAAAKSASEYYEAEGITVNTNILFSYALDWYNHTEITDEDTLAAVILAFGEFKPGTTYAEIQQARDFYFPQELFSIGEIEDSLRDVLWEV